MTRERIELNGHDESAHAAAVRANILARALDLEKNDLEYNDEETRFLRTEKRIPVRRGPLAKKTASRLKTAFTLSLMAALAGGVVVAAYGYGVNPRRFLITSSDNIEISGVHNASRAQVMEVFRTSSANRRQAAVGDIGHNLFTVPLDERRMQLEKIPWVESATVMRLLPDRLAVDIIERTPVAFVQIGSKIHLIDAGGVVLGPPARREAKYSFPVIHGITETEPLSTRASVMKIYNRLLTELAPGNYTQQLSEVDLSDPEDVKATVNDAGGTVLVHLGSSDFLERYKLFAAHIGEWRQQFQKVQSVDLRYEGQIVVNPDSERSGDRVIR
ncbi:MAG TPA: cell division protein FtsQ/DivIB [Candidatus Angelobacter sp.]